MNVDREDTIADPETTTPNGCSCVTQCGTSVGADFYKYDWCKTNDGCGYPHYVGFWFRYYWDKCQYLASSKVEQNNLAWNEKHDQMWSNIKSNNSTAPYLSKFSAIKGMLFSFCLFVETRGPNKNTYCI